MPINIRWLGARGDNVTDDTAAVQATVNAAGVAGSVFVQAGTYIVSATITCLVNQEIIGEGPNSSIFQRYADYGDTFVFPTSFACRVSKIWCRQGTPYGTTDNSLSNIIHTPSAHIRLQNAQGVVIEDCWLWRMPYQIVIEDGALVKIHRCNIQGTWDGNFAAAQEGVAGVWVGSVAYTQIVAIEHCYFGGSGNGPRTVGWTSTDTGLHTFNIVQNCGNQYAILVYRCEDFLLSNTYMGGNWLSNFAADPTAGTVNLDWRFIGNFFDGSGAQSPMMNFLTQIDGNWVNSVTISGNVFNGEEQTLHAIQAFNPTGGIIQTLAEFTITGNTFQATVGTALNILNAQGGTISGNTIVGYNCRNVSNIDLGFVAGIFIGPQCHFILSSGNLVGGQVNTVGVPSFTYSAVVISQLSQMCVEKHTLSVGNGPSGNLVGKVDAYVITKHDAGNYACVGNEDVVIVNKTVGSATTIGLPTNIPLGQMLTVKDGKGDASINPMTLTGTIDGTVNPVFNTNYISVTILWNGVEWSTVGTA
jgi:hypothetical protein